MSKLFQPTAEQKVSFELWAKTQHCNLTSSPYPESFRTYKFDRTQHMLEGWLAAFCIKGIMDYDTHVRKLSDVCPVYEVHWKGEE